MLYNPRAARYFRDRPFRRQFCWCERHVNKRWLIVWLAISGGMFLLGLIQLIQPGLLGGKMAEAGPLGLVLWLGAVGLFFLLGLLQLIAEIRGSDAGLLGRFRESLERQLPIVLLLLGILIFGLAFLFALMSGSGLASFILLLVVVSMMSVLGDYRQRQLAGPLSDIGRGGKRRLNAALRKSTSLQDKSYEIVRIRPAESHEQEGAADESLLAVTVEVRDWREYVQLAVCVIVYYAASSLAWSAWFLHQGGDLDFGQAAKLAFGFSILVLPAVLVALAAKFSLGGTLATAIVAMAVHTMLLQSPQADPQSDVAQLVQNHLEVVVGTWLAAAAALVAAERLTARLFRMQTTVQVTAPD